MFMNTGDFPKPNYPESDEIKENFVLDWKSKVRKRQDVLQNFKFIGLDKVKIPFKKIEELEKLKA